MDLVGLLQKHRHIGLLIDSNLLLLFLVGTIGRNRITTFKRTQKYSLEDFELLERLISTFSRIVTTPQILTEVSNLGGALSGKELVSFRSTLKSQVEVMDERFIEARRITGDGSFARLGITDAAIVLLSNDGPLVLTDDLDLYVAIANRRFDVVNFNHIRPASWRGIRGS